MNSPVLAATANLGWTSIGCWWWTYGTHASNGMWTWHATLFSCLRTPPLWDPLLGDPPVKHLPLTVHSAAATAAVCFRSHQGGSGHSCSFENIPNGSRHWRHSSLLQQQRTAPLGTDLQGKRVIWRKESKSKNPRGWSKSRAKRIKRSTNLYKKWGKKRKTIRGGGLVRTGVLKDLRRLILWKQSWQEKLLRWGWVEMPQGMFSHSPCHLRLY